MFFIHFTPKAFKEMESLDREIRNRIGKKLEFFCSSKNPFYFAKRLTGSNNDFFRFKIGNYRVIFYASKGEIIVLRVGHRSNVYKQFS